ncbi:MAG: ACP S-malonyltransferase, partial [bacterium]|nr:ACP S-malonyltransferase [bacterium]
MKKRIFVFPGQGSQYVGMGRDLAENIPEVANLFESADQVLGYSITDLCFNGPEERLKETRYTQPGIFTVSCAALLALKNTGVDCDDVAVAGHSLGEYTALVAAGILPFAEALKLVKLRGELMFELRYPVEGSPMAAIIGLDSARVKEIAKEVSAGDEQLFLSIYNCPGQYVVSGHPKAIERAVGLYEQAGARKVSPLKVSGPFHSPLYGEARDKLAEALEAITFEDPKRPFVNNVTADYVHAAADVKQGLVDQ